MHSSPKPVDALALLVLHEAEPNSHHSIRLTCVKFKADLCALVWSSRRKLKGSRTYDLALDQGEDAVWSLVGGHTGIFTFVEPDPWGCPVWGGINARWEA